MTAIASPTTTTLTVEANPAPTAGQRFQRSTGQAGGFLVVIQLWQAFGWFGADSWSAEEAGLRWPAITAAGIVVVAGVQNLVNWWRSERLQVPPRQAITAAAEA